MPQTQVMNNCNIKLLGVILAALVVVVLGWIIWANHSIKNNTTAEKEQFAEVVNIITTPTITSTTQPLLVSGSTSEKEALGYITQKQLGNVIYYGSNSSTVNKTFIVSPVSDSSEYGTKDMKSVINIPLSADNEPYVIKQIYISKFGSDSPSGKKIRISVVNTKDNQINFAGLHYNLTRGGSGETINNIEQQSSETIFNRITQNANPSMGIFLDDVKTMFGTDLIGNRINIFTDADDVNTTMTTSSNNIKIIITGYKESQKWKPDFLNRTTQSQVFPAGKMTLIRAISLSAPDTSLIGNKFFITFTNPYSNNVLTYPGPVDGGFIYTTDVPKILLPKMLLTNAMPEIILAKDAGNDTSTDSPKITATSYTYTTDVSQGDITQFRLEYNLTDLRGSINPDYVCPNIQSLINKQLDAEVIVDSMEYLDKTNTEKVKLSSNKMNLLTLMKQEEDIKTLGIMIDKINQLMEKRNQETDALAALQFTKQLNEVIKMREHLERRIKARDRNTFNINIRVNDSDAAAAAASGVPNIGDVFKIS